MANNFKRTVQHSLQIDIASGTKTIMNTPSVTPEPWPPAPEPPPSLDYWVNEFDRTAAEGSSALYIGAAKDSIGNTIFVGSVKGPYPAYQIPVVTKYDLYGNVLWCKILNNPYEYTAENVCTSVTTDADDNIYVLGDYDNGSTGTFFVKFDADGNIIWFKDQIGYLTIPSRKIVLDSSGNFYVFYSSFISKYSSTASIIWTREIGPSTFTYDMTVSDDKIYIAAEGVDRNLVILDTATGSLNSSFSFGPNWGTSWGITYDGTRYLYMVDGLNAFIKFDTQTSSIVWAKYLAVSSSIGTGVSFAYANNKLYFAATNYFSDNINYAGYGIFCCEIDTASGDLIWSNSINNPPNYRIYTYTNSEQYIRTLLTVNSTSYSVCGWTYNAGSTEFGLAINLPIDGAIAGETGQTLIGPYYYTNNFILDPNQCNSMVVYPSALPITPVSTTISSHSITVTEPSTSFWVNYTPTSDTYYMG